MNEKDRYQFWVLNHCIRTGESYPVEGEPKRNFIKVYNLSNYTLEVIHTGQTERPRKILYSSTLCAANGFLTCDISPIHTVASPQKCLMETEFVQNGETYF